MWGEFTKESGYAMAREALERNPKPTALFAANNFIAIGALRALKEQNYRVPEDIAIVAVDDIPPEFTLQPFLSVATQPALRIGQQACQILLERIKGDSTRPYQQVVFPTEVIIRDSSGDEISA
jgi:LacI family transcriptional regulator